MFPTSTHSFRTLLPTVRMRPPNLFSASSVIVRKPAQDIKLEKQFRSTPSTKKVWWLYVEDDTMGKLSGLDVKSECEFFILKFKMASKMAAKKRILIIIHIKVVILK